MVLADLKDRKSASLLGSTPLPFPPRQRDSRPNSFPSPCPSFAFAFCPPSRIIDSVFLPHAPERFRLESRVGSGGMGEVFRAQDLSNSITVAVKLLRKSASNEERARFKREIQVLADLRHPGIVDYVDHGEWPDGRLFLAMEWLEGEDLAQRQRRLPPGMNDSVEIVRRTAQAMAAVHGRGVVHRDLKLSNIYIVHRNLSRGVKLIDFGVAKLPNPDDFTTLPGSIIGTPYYMAPEQARGGEVDARADVYSLAAVLFRLLTGRHVFEAEHIIAFLGRLVLEDPLPASALRFDLPEALDTLLLRCLSRDPADRPADAGEFARLLAHLPAMGNEPPNSDQSASAIRRVAREDAPSQVVAATASPAPRSPTLPPAPLASLERRVIAVILASIPSASLDPNLQAQVQAILGEDARLEQLQGGRVVAALGMQKTLGDEAVRAARAALLIATTVPDARIAVATGHAVTGRGGLAGKALERAAAQLDRAAPGGIRVGKATQPLLQGRFVVRADDAGAVLLHEDLVATHKHRVLGISTPTLGRDNELEFLNATFTAVMEDGVPRAIVVVGQTGIGKSRVRQETVQRLKRHHQGIDVLLARGDSMQARTGLSALGRALRSRMGIRDGEPVALQADRVVRYVAQRPACPPGAAPFLGEFVGVPFNDAFDDSLRAAREAPHVMNAHILQAIEAILRNDAVLVPQVIIFEDLHLLDETSVDLVDWLLACNDLRLVVFAFGREELLTRFPKLWDRRASTSIGLGPLPASFADVIASMVLPQLDAKKRQIIVRRAEGNPLFLEELLRHAAEGRDELPISVQALIQARLDLLPAEQRQVVRAASVFGRSCWSDGVSTLLTRDCAADLDALARAEILVQHESSRIDGQIEWGFPQNTVFETAYASLLARDRETLHRAASEWLLSAGEEDLGAIARHAEAGADKGRAAVLFARASSQAYGNGQLEAALDFIDRSIACGEDSVVRSQALLQQAQILGWLGRFEAQLAASEAAADLAEPGTDPWGDAHRLAAAAMRELGRAADADERLSWTLAHPRAESLTPATCSRLHAERTRSLVDLGRPQEARDVAHHAIAIAQAAGDSGRGAMLRALDARSMALAFLGDVSASIDAAREVAEHADLAGDAVLATRARVNLGSVLNRVGRFRDAATELHRALEDARRFRMRTIEGFALQNLGMSHARLDDLDTAIQLERDAHGIGESMDHGRLKLTSKLYEAVMLAWRGGPGDLGAALQIVQRVRAEATAYPVTEIEATALLARIQFSRRAFEAAIEACEDALARLQAVGSAEEGEELLRLTHVEALLACGQTSEADAALEAAWHCVVDRASQMSSPEHRSAYLSCLAECRRIVELGVERLGFEHPMAQAPDPTQDQTSTQSDDFTAPRDSSRRS